MTYPISLQEDRAVIADQFYVVKFTSSNGTALTVMQIQWIRDAAGVVLFPSLKLTTLSVTSPKKSPI